LLGVQRTAIKRRHVKMTSRYCRGIVTYRTLDTIYSKFFPRK